MPESLTAGPLEPTDFFDGGDTVVLAGVSLEVLHTPGHTPGSVCFLTEGALFSGDTLFARSCGRMDLPGGSPAQMRGSLDRLRQLPFAGPVYPGHGGATTLAEERRWNPYLKGKSVYEAASDRARGAVCHRAAPAVFVSGRADGAGGRSFPGRWGGVDSLPWGDVFIRHHDYLVSWSGIPVRSPDAFGKGDGAAAAASAAAELLRRGLPPAAGAAGLGALAGVRPTKITTKFLLEGGSVRSAEALLKQVYYVTPLRRQLCMEASQATVQAVKLLRPGDVSVYVGIPFVPPAVRIAALSALLFPGRGALLETYLQALLREIQAVGRMLASSGLQARTLYIGGGTPTTLSAEQLERLLSAIDRHISLTGCLEYTVEAGRPDTITGEKLQVLARHGVRRVSINPQSMDDRVLAAVDAATRRRRFRRAFSWPVKPGWKS